MTRRGDIDWAGRRVTVMGLGTRGGGSGVARYLAEQGALVTVTDLRSEDDLRSQVRELERLGIGFVLGRHDESDFETADVIVRNPGVRRDNRYLEIARAAGATVEMEMTIFLRACPAPVIGITGTKGKTSTSALCGEMLRSFRSDTLVAGNMGVSAVAQLPTITPETPVVLELSSWQLEGMDERGVGPDIAVITNISEDHLDTYADFADYAETKRSISRHLEPGNALVLNADDPLVAHAATSTAARLVWFGANDVPGPGVRVHRRQLLSTIANAEGAIDFPASDHFRGVHQRLNAAAAAAAALLCRASLADVRAGLERFGGIANRMELVTTVDGVQFINDTAATAPAAAIASLRSFPVGAVHLIAGGADKRLPPEELAKAISALAASVVLLAGTATPRLRELIEDEGRLAAGEVAMSMDEAVERAAAGARPGDIVLLSPGCASFGLFRDEFDRGDQFRRAAMSLSRTGARA